MRRLAPFAIASLAACAASPVCDTTHTPGDMEPFVTDALGGTEGITFSPEGRLFVTAGGDVHEVFPDGTHKPFAKVPHSVGAAWWGDALFVASSDDGSGGDTAFCAPNRRGGVYRVSSAGAVTLFAKGMNSPNFLAVTPRDTLLVTDDCPSNKVIWEVDTAGVVSKWSEEVESPNGVVFSPDGATAFVASTFRSPPAIWKIPLAEGKPSGAVTKIVDFPGGSAADGLALDADGNVYTALNTKGELHVTAPDGTTELFADRVPFLASLAFGRGEFDGCSLYGTSLRLDGSAKTDVFRIHVGRPGAKLYE